MGKVSLMNENFHSVIVNAGFVALLGQILITMRILMMKRSTWIWRKPGRIPASKRL